MPTFVATLAFHALVLRPLARRQLRRWARRAEAIADPGLRDAVLATLRDERGNSEGAAAFAVLHPPAARRLVPLLVAYQLTWDLVDTLLERGGGGEAARGLLESAITSNRGSTHDDEGPDDRFLGELVETCRAGCAALPRYAEAEPVLRRLVAHSDALLVTNGAEDGRSDALRRWVRRGEAQSAEVEPVELCAAAHCSLAVHALLATASNPRSQIDDLEAVEAAYFPWIDALCTMLDSLVDQEDDARTGDFSFIGQYPSAAYAETRLRAIAGAALEATRALPAADRHAALLCALVGMYVSAPAARTPEARRLAAAVIDATAPLSRRAERVLAFGRTATRKRRRAERSPSRDAPEWQPWQWRAL